MVRYDHDNTKERIQMHLEEWEICQKAEGQRHKSLKEECKPTKK